MDVDHAASDTACEILDEAGMQIGLWMARFGPTIRWACARGPDAPTARYVGRIGKYLEATMNAIEMHRKVAGMGNETQETVYNWINTTFPGTDPDSPRKSLRLIEECVELCIASGASFEDIRNAVDRNRKDHRGRDDHDRSPEPDKIAAEAADVLIVLYGVAGMRGFDLHAEVDAKMSINRCRRWAARGDGTGYHIKESFPAPASPGPDAPGAGVGP